MDFFNSLSYNSISLDPREQDGCEMWSYIAPVVSDFAQCHTCKQIFRNLFSHSWGLIFRDQTSIDIHQHLHSQSTWME